LFGWHLNQEAGDSPNAMPAAEFYRASQFERALYRPDIINAALSDRARPNDAPATSRLRDWAPPALNVQTDVIDSTDGATASIVVNAQARQLPIADWNVVVNGVPQISRRERLSRLGPAPHSSLRTVVPVRLTSSRSIVRVEVTAAGSTSDGPTRSVSSNELTVRITNPSTARRGTLFIASVGVGRFGDNRIKPLKFAARDAQQWSATLATAGRSVYSDVRTLLITDASRPLASSIALIKELTDFVADAGPDDVVILFVASHGFSSPRGDYFFVPPSASWDAITALQQGRSSDQSSLISWEALLGVLSEAAGRRALIIDTCSSGAVIGNFDAYSLGKRSLGAGVDLLTASSGTEESQEYPEAGHGLFTFGMLEALRAGRDTDADGLISLQDAFEFAASRVDALRNRATGPQTPQILVSDDTSPLPLGRAGAVSGAEVAPFLPSVDQPLQVASIAVETSP
jgi:hypothetical protein